MTLEPAVTVTVTVEPSTSPVVGAAVTVTGTDAVSAPAGLIVAMESKYTARAMRMPRVRNVRVFVICF
jgi:hypothetical protein